MIGCRLKSSNTFDCKNPFVAMMTALLSLEVTMVKRKHQSTITLSKQPVCSSNQHARVITAVLSSQTFSPELTRSSVKCWPAILLGWNAAMFVMKSSSWQGMTLQLICNSSKLRQQNCANQKWCHFLNVWPRLHKNPLAAELKQGFKYFF